MSTIGPSEAFGDAEQAFEGYGASRQDALVEWSADLGPGVGLDRIADYLAALATVLDLAERVAYAPQVWPVRIARAPTDLSRADWTIFEPRIHQAIFGLPYLQGSIGIPATRSLRRIETIEVHYENPLSALLKVPSALVAPVGGLLRMIRDWSADKRTATAHAEQAEAEAAAARANARRAATRANIAEWAAKEIQGGRGDTLTAEQLLVLATEADLRALNALAEPPVELAVQPAA